MCKLSILIYKGEPLDYHEYRHTALYLQYSNKHSILHIVGTQGMFEFVEVINGEPSTIGSLARIVPVGNISDVIGSDLVRTTVSKTPIKNGPQDLDWNCQNWVGDALGRLVERTYIPVSQREVAIDRMMDACLEAQDD